MYMMCIRHACRSDPPWVHPSPPPHVSHPLALWQLGNPAEGTPSAFLSNLSDIQAEQLKLLRKEMAEKQKQVGLPSPHPSRARTRLTRGAMRRLTKTY